MATCGDFGGRNSRGKPCGRTVNRGRCHLHPPSEEDPLPLRLIEAASDDDPYPMDDLTAQARRLWDTYQRIVPEHEHAELYAATLAFDGMVRAGAALARDGATVEDKAHGKESKGNAASLVYRRMSQSWNEWVERLKLADRVDELDRNEGVTSIARYM